eukprot:CAMPEP_0197581978 /NCGR_PEP_ID=MMETSP1326-20131121/5324_1 /TAXON_ID=1155430 /ORGANISM="Genus nov. species nov., Strain RCC2288" /LENGTH=268 /DNA_ID=CAMNT_0043145969 /DNA_START=136 /DNA_END=940 /DNA_ORIENTATION=-
MQQHGGGNSNRGRKNPNKNPKDLLELVKESEEGAAGGEFLGEEQRDKTDHSAAAVGHLGRRPEEGEVLGLLLEAVDVVAAEAGREGCGDREEHSDGDEERAGGGEGAALDDAVGQGERAGVDHLAEQRVLAHDLALQRQHPADHRRSAVDHLDGAGLLEGRQRGVEQAQVVAVGAASAMDPSAGSMAAANLAAEGLGASSSWSCDAFSGSEAARVTTCAARRQWRALRPQGRAAEVANWVAEAAAERANMLLWRGVSGRGVKQGEDAA